MRISDWSSDVCSSDLAVCGGIDVGARRWDTRDHEDDDPHRTAPDGKAYMPWHDSTMILAGRVGNALADLGNERWQRATKRRSEEHTSELQSLMRISYAVFCLKKQKTNKTQGEH